MRLSEAIRLGAMLAPQAAGALFSKDGACTLGAALLAVGVTSEGSAKVTALALWQCGNRRVCHVPVVRRL
jgi:hypothetical protein